ncbi:MAG: ATP-binding protein [Candidatus Babeliales bacterium]
MKINTIKIILSILIVLPINSNLHASPFNLRKKITTVTEKICATGRWTTNNYKKILCAGLLAGYFTQTPGGKELGLDIVKLCGGFVQGMYESPSSIYSYTYQGIMIAAQCLGAFSLFANTGSQIKSYFSKKDDFQLTKLKPETKIYKEIVKSLKEPDGFSKTQKLINFAFTSNGYYGDIPAEFENFACNIIRKKNEQVCANIEKGMMLYGPPGNGKTLSIRILAELCNIPIVEISIAKTVAKYVGETAKNINACFEEAKQQAKIYKHAIIFIDEAEVLTQNRNGAEHLQNGGTQEALNTLLTRLDGIEKLKNTTVIIATNKKDKIDHAFIRTGRFDTKIKINNPDPEKRWIILEEKLKRVDLDIGKLNIEKLVALTEGFSAADCNVLIEKCRDKLLNEKLNNNPNLSRLIDFSRFTTNETEEELKEKIEQELEKQKSLSMYRLNESLIYSILPSFIKEKKQQSNDNEKRNNRFPQYHQTFDNRPQPLQQLSGNQQSFAEVPSYEFGSVGYQNQLRRNPYFNS